jgi:hypothetical protein
MWASPWAKAIFVDGEDGLDSMDGFSPIKAKKTIQGAIDIASRGDVIYVRPQQYTGGTGFSRYTEEVTVTAGASAGSAAHFENADISIIGCVNTPNPEYGVRWKHATDTTGYCLINHAPALHLENIGFFAESAAGAMSILNNGATTTQRGTDGTTIYNCVIKGTGIIVRSGGDGFTVQNTRFHCGSDGAVANIDYSCSANPGRRLLIRNCEWQDGNGTTSSGPCITIAAPMTELLIRDCYFGQQPTGDVYIATAGANYGLIANCFFNHDDLDTDAAITLGTGVLAVGCYDAAGIATTA